MEGAQAVIERALQGYGLLPDATRPRSMIDRVPWDTAGSFVGPYGIEYPLLLQQTLVGSKETIAPEFLGFLHAAYKASPIVFGCIVNRMMLFSEARFQFRERRNGRPGNLFGSDALRPLEQPWPGGTTGDLLALAEAHVSCAGNFFAARRGDRIKPMRPDWTCLVVGSEEDEEMAAWDLDAEVIGYVYQPGGPGGGVEPETLLADEVAHYMPIPDPEAPCRRGMSWLTPLIREICADKQLTEHKESYLQQGATPNMIVKVAESDPDKAKKLINLFRREHEGAANRFKTLFLSPGFDATPVGSNLQETDFVNVQSAGELRIATDAMVPPAVLALKETLTGSSLSGGNFEAAWRQFGHNMRPLWRNFAGSMARIIDVPSAAELWYDDRDIPALKEDGKKAADITRVQAAAINTFITAGFDPDSAVDAVTSGDLSRLKHTGLTSVQLHPPGSNGNGDAAARDMAVRVMAQLRRLERGGAHP
jgi:Phage portal protein